jgi:MOSC domain-containing protein YiiM
MMQQGCPGFYLAVAQAGTIEAGQTFSVVAGSQGLSVRDAFSAQRLKHLR